MSDDSFWGRVRKGRLFQVLAVYLGVCWVVLQVVGELSDALALPQWVGAVSIILLAVGLVVILATAWVQSRVLVMHPEADALERGSWELGIRELGASLRRGRLPHLTWSRTLLSGAVAFLLLFGFAGLYVVIQDRGDSFQPAAAFASEDAAPAVAVLPFTVRGEGLEIWRDGMVEALSTNLDGAGGLRAIDSRTVLARWRDRFGVETSPDLPTALEVARATGARWALIGSVIGGTGDLRLTADVHDLVSGEVIGEGQVEGPPAEIFDLVDGLSIEVLRSLNADPSLGSSFDLARITTGSVGALRTYLEGQALFRSGEFEAAIPLFERAIEEDSTFALAYHRLSSAYGWSGGIASPARREAMEGTIRYADRLPQREALLLRARYEIDHGHLTWVDSLRMAVRRYPDDAEAWHLLGESYLHGAGPRVPTNLEEIEETFGRAAELDPNFAPYLIHWFDLATWHRPDSAEAARRLDQLRRAAPEARHVRPKELVFDLTFGDSATRAVRLAALDTMPRQMRIGALSEGFHHARHATSREAVLRSVAADTRGGDRPPWMARLFQNLAHGQGRIEAGLAVLDDPIVRQGPRRFCELWEASAMGLPVPEEVLAEAEANAPLEVGSLPCIYLARGARAAERGDRAELARARELLGESFEAYLEEQSPDSAEAAAGRAWRDAHVRALDGYAAWLRGEHEAAAEILEEAVPHTPDVVRWWLARVHLEQDRPTRAEPWLRSFWWDEHTLAYFHLGKAYEALGDEERARDAYRYFVDGWSGADSELQPMVAEAREALAGLEDGATAAVGSAAAAPVSGDRP